MNSLESRVLWWQLVQWPQTAPDLVRLSADPNDDDDDDNDDEDEDEDEEEEDEEEDEDEDDDDDDDDEDEEEEEDEEEDEDEDDDDDDYDEDEDEDEEDDDDDADARVGRHDFQLRVISGWLFYVWLLVSFQYWPRVVFICSVPWRVALVLPGVCVGLSIQPVPTGRGFFPQTASLRFCWGQGITRRRKCRNDTQRWRDDPCFASSHAWNGNESSSDPKGQRIICLVSMRQHSWNNVK